MTSGWFNIYSFCNLLALLFYPWVYVCVPPLFLFTHPVCRHIRIGIVLIVVFIAVDACQAVGSVS